MSEPEVSVWKKNKNETFWNIVNSLLFGMSAFLGSVLTTKTITKESILIGLISSALVIVMKLSAYWQAEEKEYAVKLFNIVGVS